MTEGPKARGTGKTSRRLRLIGVGVACVAATIGFLTAKVIAPTARFPFGVINRVSDTIASEIRAAIVGKPVADDPYADLTLFTTFVPIKGTAFPVPRAPREGEGGGLTSVGSDVILLTHDGRIFAVDADGLVTPTHIEAPRNGFEDYRALHDDPRFSANPISPEYLRYNDIQFVEDTKQPALVVSFTRFHGARECYTTTVARLQSDQPGLAVREWSADADDWRVIFETVPCLPLKTEWRALEGHMAGGRMAYEGAGILYLASGDYSWDGIYGPAALASGAGPLAQDPGTDYGKVIRLDLDSGTAKRLTSGQRNTQGIAIDGAGTVWTVEHGMRGGDELNRIEPGANYGWPLETYGTLYSGLPPSGIETPGFHDKYVQPIFAWLPSIATSSLAYIHGFHETWDGDLLVGSLRGQQLVRVRIRESRTVFAEAIPVGFRVRYVLQHSDGRIVLWNGTDKIVFLAPDIGGLGYRLAMYLLDKELKPPPTAKADVVATFGRCIECHSLDEGDHHRAPSLAKIYGAPIGATSYQGYSDAMRNRSGTWTTERLNEFLRNPGEAIPGTLMPSGAVANPETRKILVLLLEQLATRIEIPPNDRW